MALGSARRGAPTLPEINFKLLDELAQRPHPRMNYRPCECHNWCGEINSEAKIVQHLLDLAEIPSGKGVHDSNIDARVYLALVELAQRRVRLGRITDWHRRDGSLSGVVGDLCVECQQRWPCETRRMADGTHEDLFREAAHVD